MRRLLSILAVISFASCGTALNEGEDYGNLLNTPSGLVLTEGEHAGGWGRAECTQCHNLEEIHLVNRTGVAIDIQAIHDQALQQGVASCATCHGTNGVP